MHESKGNGENRTQIAMKLEAVVIPVSDVDRAKDFYGRLGWRLDADLSDGESRLIQYTPPGSGCSIQFGSSLIATAAGSAQGLYLVVADIELARAELIALEVDASEIFHCATGYLCTFPGKDGRNAGLQPERGSYGSFVSFQDPDGNGWLLQEVTRRLPGRVSGDTTYGSAGELAEALRRAASAHGQHELWIGHADPNWPDWYADYLVREQAGDTLPE